MAIVVGVCLPVVVVVLAAARLDDAALNVGRTLAAHTGTWLRGAEADAIEFVTADDRPVGSPAPHAPAASETGTALRARGGAAPRRLASDVALSEAAATLPRPVTSRFVSAGQVLELAKGGSVPRGTSIGAGDDRPPGVRYVGVSVFGVGLVDGDVLTHVAGQPVRSEEDVVTLVLSARQRRASHITGRFWRAGESHELVVEMPYPKRMAARNSSEPSSVGVTTPGVVAMRDETL
jgi:hypothetical protein